MNIEVLEKMARLSQNKVIILKLQKQIKKLEEENQRLKDEISSLENKK